MKKVLFTLLVSFIFSLLLAQPVWFKNPKSFDPSEELIIGVGEGVSYDDATAIAKAELVQQITVNVRTDSRISFLSSESESSIYYTEYINQNIKSTSEAQLTGLLIREKVTENGKFYVMVTLNKTRMFNNMENEMKNIANKIKNSMKNAENHKTDGNLILALNNLADAQKYLSDIIVKKFFYDNFATRPYQLKDIVSDTEIENQVKEVISKINFEVITGNLQTARRGSELPEPIIFQASSRKAGGTRNNLSGLPVKLFYGDGEVIETGFTNYNGEYSVHVVASVSNGERGRVSIQINPDKFPAFYNRIIKNKSAEAHFKVTEGHQIYTRLSVVDEKGNIIQNAVSRITVFLANNNVSVRDNGTFFFKGIGSVRDIKVLEGSNIARHIVNVNVELQLGVSATNNIIGTIRGSGSGASDRSEADAINLAYRNLNFNNRDLVALINLAKGQSELQVVVPTN